MTITIDTPGVTITDRFFNEQVDVRAPDVTLVRPFIDAQRSWLYCLKQWPEARRLRVVDPQYRNAIGKAVLSTGWMLTKGGSTQGCGQDGFFIVGNYTETRGHYVTGNGWVAGGHADPVQIMGGMWHRVIDCQFVVPHGVNGLVSNSCVYVEADYLPIANVTVANNLCDGGLYSVWIIDGRENSVDASTCKVIGNAFGRAFYRSMNVKAGTLVTRNIWINETVREDYMRAEAWGEVIESSLPGEPIVDSEESDRFHAIVEEDMARHGERG